MTDKTVKVRYVGGIDEVDVKLPSGQVLLNVKRNHQVQVSEDDAKALADNPDWHEVSVAPKENDK